MSKKFFKYTITNDKIYISEADTLNYVEPDKNTKSFLIYAENIEDALALALQHVYNNKPFSIYRGIYNGKVYDEVKCIKEI